MFKGWKKFKNFMLYMQGSTRNTDMNATLLKPFILLLFSNFKEVKMYK